MIDKTVDPSCGNRYLQDFMEAAGIEPASLALPNVPISRKFCLPACRDPWFQECADYWKAGGNPALWPQEETA